MDDYFHCPVCDARVPADAPCCPGCGSDEETGWSEETYLDGIEMPNDEPAVAAEWHADWVWWVAAVLIALFLLGWIVF